MEERTQPKIIAPHGGYYNLKSYQMAEIIHDAVMATWTGSAGATKKASAFFARTANGSGYR